LYFVQRKAARASCEARIKFLSLDVENPLKVKSLLMTVLMAAALVILFAVVIVRTLENRLIYFPPRYPEGFAPSDLPESEGEDVWLTTRDNVRINAFYLPHPSSSKVLLWFHGNAENIGYGFARMQALWRIGVSILAVDYRGYGKSEGRPNEAGVYLDADAAYDYLVKQKHVRAQNIFLYGNSLGSAVALDLAARQPCGGVIVQSSFTNAREMTRRMFRIPLVEYLPKTRFDSLQKICRVHAPILIVHGTRDEVVPFEMGRRLFAAASEPKRFYPVEGAGHNDVIEVGGDAYLQQLAAFVGRSYEIR
jgi:pimeloyl-ACP methyl ester carboxylesterase